MKTLHVPYTYRIRWSKTNVSYYGVRYSADCHPSDLFVTYFTSSKYVKEYIDKHGLPDIIQIRKTFSDSFSAREWEGKVLKRMKVTQSDKWLNKHDIKSFEPMYGDDNPMRDKDMYARWYNIVTSESHRAKLIDAWSKDEVRSKTSGENHYSKRDGWQSSIKGDKNPMKDPAIVKKAMQNRGSYVGEKNPRAKLSLDNVRMIKSISEWPRGLVSKLSRELNVSRNAINLIRFGKNWNDAS